MQWLQAMFQSRTQHKYAINSKMLGDDEPIAWSNLGYWDGLNTSYPHACSRLASRLADAVHLNSNDRMLDLGCGQGASLQLWKMQYHVQHIEAVELQPYCVGLIQQNLEFIHNIQCDSFLNLNTQNFEFKFDVILCIDAAYHSSLNSFLHAVSNVLNSKGRIGFHTLSLTEKFLTLNLVQKLKYKALLKCADVTLYDLKTVKQIKQILTQQGYDAIQVENLTQPVLSGFAGYILKQKQKKAMLNNRCLQNNVKDHVDGFKIEMTSKLCQILYRDGLIDYVQITAARRN